jgi:hypothetical protein
MNRAGINEEVQDQILSLIDRGRVVDAMGLAEKHARDQSPLRILEELIMIKARRGECPHRKNTKHARRL